VSGRSGESGIAFLRGAETEAFAGPGVELAGEGFAGPLGEMGHAGALGEVLPVQAVGVLVGAALPGVMGRGEVDAGAGGAIEGGVAVELGPIVGGDGAHGPAFALDEVLGAAIDGRGGAAGSWPRSR
jgi:hypothetical protein